VGTHHPDVEALSIAAASDMAPGFVFRSPPMLRRSWAVVVGATVRYPSLVPSESIAAAVALRIWGEEPWLLWTRRATDRVTDLHASSDAPGRSADMASIGELVRSYLDQSQRSGDPSQALGGAGFAAPVQDVATVSLESPTDYPAMSPDEATLRRLVRATGVPRATLDVVIADLQQGQ
jgi:hypothetical protein